MLTTDGMLVSRETEINEEKGIASTNSILSFETTVAMHSFKKYIEIKLLYRLKEDLPSSAGSARPPLVFPRS